MRSLLAPSQGVSPGQQPNTLPIPPLPLLWVVIKLMKAACPISALPAAAWNSSDHPCKTVAGSSPADALEDGGIQLVADELPSKPCARRCFGCSDTPWGQLEQTRPWASWADTSGCSPGFSRRHLSPQQEQSRAGCTARQMEERGRGRVGKRIE